MPRKQQGWITFQSSEEERQLLEHHSQQTQRSKTEILRELLRTLDSYASELPIDHLDAVDRLENPAQAGQNQPLELLAMKISARNVLKGKVKRLISSGVNTEVTIEIAPQVNLVSVITTASAQQLGLDEGKEVFAVIKSSNVMIATG